MKALHFALLGLVALSGAGSFAATTALQEPLRVFIQSGPKSHGPGAHDYPRFLKEWVPS